MIQEKGCCFMAATLFLRMVALFSGIPIDFLGEIWYDMERLPFWLEVSFEHV